jgi:ferredoxin
VTPAVGGAVICRIPVATARPPGIGHEGDPPPGVRCLPLRIGPAVHVLRGAARLREDRVTAAADPVAGSGRLDVVCAAAGMVLDVPPGTSILEAVRQAGLAVPPACTDGRCAACETRVLEGEPDHRDVVLTDEERRCGETMMICVSRATTPSLVLDL